jgi:hypothetical protein
MSVMLDRQYLLYVCNMDMLHGHVSHEVYGGHKGHVNPLIRGIGHYTLRDLHQQYKKYIHKRTKHILL